MNQGETKQEKWNQRLLLYQMESVVKLDNIPKELSEKVFVEYLAKNKARHQRGSSKLYWLLFLWLPALLFIPMAPFIIVNLYLFMCELFGIDIMQLLELFLDLSDIYPHLYLGTLALPVFIGGLGLSPFLPILMIRKQQTHYAAYHEYKHNNWFCNWIYIPANPEESQVKRAFIGFYDLMYKATRITLFTFLFSAIIMFFLIGQAPS